MSIADIIIIAVLAAWFVFALVRVIKKRKSGSCCSGDCSSCDKSC